MLQYDCENEKREEGIQLVGISLFEYGMVIAASDGLLTFFDTDEEGEFVPLTIGVVPPEPEVTVIFRFRFLMV